MKMKRAVLDHLLLGAILAIILFLFAATVADEYDARKKYYQLKNITDNAVVTIYTTYMENYLTYHDRDAAQAYAESISQAMLDKTKLGSEIKNSYGGLEYVWTWNEVYPDTVTARITGYRHGTFWWKLFEKAYFTINAESTLNPEDGSTSDMFPMAINGCSEDGVTMRDDLFPGPPGSPNIITFEFTGYNDYFAIDQDASVGITQKCTDPTGNAFFADYKNDFSKNLVNDDGFFDSDIEVDVTDDNLCLPGVDFDNPDTVDPKQLYDSLKGFPNPTTMDIVVLNCDSVAADVNMYRILRVKMIDNECTGGTFTFDPADYQDQCPPPGAYSQEVCNTAWLSKVWSQTQPNCAGNPDYKLLKISFEITSQPYSME
jgi:hypothetical protein